VARPTEVPSPAQDRTIHIKRPVQNRITVLVTRTECSVVSRVTNLCETSLFEAHVRFLRNLEFHLFPYRTKLRGEATATPAGQRSAIIVFLSLQ
jgi:hypothetical protein